MVRKKILNPQSSILKKTRIGLFGGTFNPIHIGHIKMAEAALKQFKLDKLYFIPAGIPPHKPKKGLIPAKKRYRLVKQAVDKLNKEIRSTRYEVRGAKPFEVLDTEIKKKTKCYTINTIKSLLRSILNPQNSVLYFLIGQDEFEKLHTWKKASELAKLVTFIVLPRSMKYEIRSKKYEKKHRRKKVLPHTSCLVLPDLKWHKLKAKPINISSTEIRKQTK